MNSFISWVGGKKLLRKEIIKKFPKEEIEKYVEPFGGSAWVLFGKTPHSNGENSKKYYWKCNKDKVTFDGFTSVFTRF